MKIDHDATPPVPFVTVVIPVLNGERWIAECLESLRVQTFQDFGVLLIDDGCTDNTVAIAQNMGLASLRIIQGSREGPGSARALGVNSSSSPLIATQDADDVSDRFRLERQVKYMVEHPDCVIVGSWAQNISENGSIIGTMKVPEDTRAIRLAMNFSSPFINTSTLLRKEAVVRAGNYGQGSPRIFAEDYDLFSRMTHLGELHNIQVPLVSYRIHAGSTTGTQGRLLARSGCTIAIRTTESTLDKRLSDPDRRLFSLFFGRHRRVSLGEAFRLYRILFRVVIKSGFPLIPRGMPWRMWLVPIAWRIRAPLQSIPLWAKDETIQIP